jgi:hypothetical protein
MNNHEFIKTMNKEEMALLLYLFLEPFLGKDETEHENAKKRIKEFLEAEISGTEAGKNAN